MKQTIVFGLLIIAFTSFGKTKTAKTNMLLTSKYSGFYSYGKNIEKERVVSILIYAETDSTILFYIDLNRGAPSYNMGSLYGRVKIKNDGGTFFTKYDYAENGCKWSLNFTKNSLIIKTIDNQYDCEFGHAVFADGTFKRKSNKIQDYFEEMEGEKVYFTKTTPEDYYKD